MSNAKFVNGEPVSLTYAIVFVGEIVAVHPNTKNEYLPDVLFPNDFVACTTTNAFGGGTPVSLSSDLFDIPTDTGTEEQGYVPDLSDNRFLQGSSTYDFAGVNTHTHRWATSDGSETDTWQSDGSTLQTIDARTVDDYSGTTVHTFYVDNVQEYWTEGVDSRPQYFSVKYFMRIN